MVNPASANGLGACTPAQIGLPGTKEGKPSFRPTPANCPDASKIGTVEIDTPLLDHPLPGASTWRTSTTTPSTPSSPSTSPSTTHRPASSSSSPAKVEPDPVTGQLTTTFDENPQLPFEDFKLDFFGGARAPLRTPPTCGAPTPPPPR